MNCGTWCQAAAVSDPAGFAHSRLRQSTRTATDGRSLPVAPIRERTGSPGPMRRLERPSCWPDGFTSTTTSYRPATCSSSGCWAVIRRPWSTWCTRCWTRLPESRGGAEPLLQTLETYFATGAVATETAPPTPHVGAHRDLPARESEDSSPDTTRRPSPTLSPAHGGPRSPAPQLARLLRPTPTAAGVAGRCSGFERRAACMLRSWSALRTLRRPTAHRASALALGP